VAMSAPCAAIRAARVPRTEPRTVAAHMIDFSHRENI
jgi:hypothetical protein